MLVYFLLMVGLCGAAILFTFRFLISLPGRHQIRKNIANWNQSIQELRNLADQSELKTKQNLEAARYSFRQACNQMQNLIRLIQNNTEASTHKILQLQQEYSRQAAAIQSLHPLQS